METSLEEYLHQNAWCESCQQVVPTSLCQARGWVFWAFAAIIILSIRIQVVSWF
jgi:hypothetical protein